MDSYIDDIIGGGGMTDKLKDTVETALEALETILMARSRGLGINYIEGYADTTLRLLRQDLDQLPDTTKMIDTGTDRGAWSDVPDATKWVDELRGDNDVEEPPTDSVIIAGAIYDFAGFITTRNKVIRVGATADAAPVADLVKEWADRRGLSLDNAAVGWWQDVLEEQPNSTTDVVEPELVKETPKRWQGLTDDEITDAYAGGMWILAKDPNKAFARAIEAKLKEKNYGQPKRNTDMCGND